MNILKQYKLEDVILLDIETVRIQKDLDPDSDLWKSWQYKQRYASDLKDLELSLEQSFNNKAALYSEFGKIVCITIGAYREGKINLKSYYGDDEDALLKDFSSAINAMQANNKNVVFATHSGKGFDIPFIMRRLIVNRLPIPQMIDVAGLKPWLVNIIDIKELWQGTGFYSASLLNIAVALGLPSSKEDISGSETSDVYYNEEGGLERIVRYCERDVICTGNILLVMKGLDPFEVAEPLKADPPAGIMDKLHNSGVISEKEEKYLTKTIEKLTPEEQEIANELLKIVTTK